MALKKAKKVVDSYAKSIATAESAVYVSFKGLGVLKQEQLRKKLFAEKMNYTVVKKSLWSIAAKAAGIKGESPAVGAEMAVLWGVDLLAPARIAHEFSKANKKAIAILGGIFDGSYKNAQEMMSIATIPSREVLLSQLAYLLKSPIQRLAIGIDAVAQKKN